MFIWRGAGYIFKATLSPEPNLKHNAYDPNNPDIVNFFDYDVPVDNWLAGPLLWA
ncbi:MAG: hypothetical protein JSV99_00010 [Planctomycetota bacterium]|nr:MAG: hypothetical protein JSV99_00010 [Planctomycetota bacterium]